MNYDELTYEARLDIAMGAVRSVIRMTGQHPEDFDGSRALVVLDDFARQYPERLASIWYAEASRTQIRRFREQWNSWRRWRTRALRELAA